MPQRSTPAPKCVIVMEPTWDGFVHMPNNIGLLLVARAAYPAAELHFVGGAEQIAAMRGSAPQDVLASTVFTAWPTDQDRDHPALATVRRRRALRNLPGGLLARADLLLLASCTGPVLTALAWAGLAPRSFAVLHGNANELRGWRSRDPLWRGFDLSASMRRFCRQGGRSVVLEERIQAALARDYPWFSGRLHVLPHPLLPGEGGGAAAAERRPAGDAPLRIGFAGLATVAKGFPAFLELAAALQRRRPGAFEFHAVGPMHAQCAALDQSLLTSKAGATLSRSDFAERFSALDYLFVWYSDDYYGYAASGVLYDAVNFGVPIIGRESAQLTAWAGQGHTVAQTFGALDDAVQALAAADPDEQAALRARHRASLATLRGLFDVPNLGRRLQQMTQAVH